jgi:3,4-dihydroxy 2-butanone 4-phosphate synthase/GTP cyclohydrolase II
MAYFIREYLSRVRAEKMLGSEQQDTSTVSLAGERGSSPALFRKMCAVGDPRDTQIDRHAGTRPRTVARVAEARLPTDFGEFRIAGYRSLDSDEEFVALVRGESSGDSPTLARIHSQCLTGDVFGSVKCDCGRQLRAAMELIEREGRGAIVYQLQEGRGIGIINKIRAYALQDEGADTVEANERLGLEVDLRRYDQCAEIFLDLGLRRVRVMSNNPEKIRAFERAGMSVVERVSLEVEQHDGFAHYLKTKRERMGHLIHAV